MALNKEVFRVRAISAVAFVIVMLAGLLWNHWSFLVLFSIIHFGCWWEYINLIEKIDGAKINRYLRFGLMLSGFGIMLWFCEGAYRIGGYGLKENLSLPFTVAGFALLIAGSFQKNSFGLKNFGVAALGWLYISLCWGVMISLRQEGMEFKGLTASLEDSGRLLPVVLITSIWINDTMAYIVGSFIGKTPFSKISPKKTWEGTIGGALLCVLVMSVASHYLFGFAWHISIAIPLIAAVVGTMGDLLESKIKRLANVKDSGTMMPGHGGFMDRFDSLLLATPVVWVYVQLAISTSHSLR
ncbi:MAG: phosphatidate cytidylyltransferase [Chitinophagaceae bacterium]